MSQSPRLRQVNYSDAAKAFSDKDVQDDINNACGLLAQALGAMMERFEVVAQQMHSIDMKLSTSFKPKWESMRKDLAEVLWQFRTNSAVISGRLKLFCATVLPMTARNVDPSLARSQTHLESMQALQSFMTISAEHAGATKALTDYSLRVTAHFVAFFSDFLRTASRYATTGAKEMAEVCQRTTELERALQSLLHCTGELCNVNPDVIHLLFVASRFVSASGRTGTRSKLRKPISLEACDLNAISSSYEYFDRKRSEVAHAQYTTQLRQSRNDPLAIAENTVFSLVQDLLVMLESGLTIDLAIWARLRSDCGQVFQWIKQPPGSMAIPHVVTCYLQGGQTVYLSLARGLDAYVAAIDPSLYIQETRDGR